MMSNFTASTLYCIAYFAWRAIIVIRSFRQQCDLLKVKKKSTKSFRWLIITVMRVLGIFIQTSFDVAVYYRLVFMGSALTFRAFPKCTIHTFNQSNQFLWVNKIFNSVVNQFAVSTRQKFGKKERIFTFWVFVHLHFCFLSSQFSKFIITIIR